MKEGSHCCENACAPGREGSHCCETACAPGREGSHCCVAPRLSPRQATQTACGGREPCRGEGQVYQAPVRARAGEWVDVRLPLASFVLTDRGLVYGSRVSAFFALHHARFLRFHHARGLVYGSRVTPRAHAHAKRLRRRKKTDARSSLWRTKRSSLAAWTMRGHAAWRIRTPRQ